MARLILFSAESMGGTVKEFRNNDPNLVLNGNEFTLESAVGLSGIWTLYDDIAFGGATITLSDAGGPEVDGAYQDYADWGGAGPFLVMSIQHN